MNLKNKYYNPYQVPKEELDRYNKVNKFISNHLNNERPNEWNIGYEIFGILLFNFCDWIHKNIIKNNIKKIFFLSRDGYIIKQVYDILFNDVETSYFYVSRKSLVLPASHNKKKSIDIIDNLTLPPMFKIQDLLNCFKIKEQDVTKYLKKNNISNNEIFYRKNFKKNAKILNLIEDIKEMIQNRAYEQYSIFREYLIQEDFNGNIAIVDIGWHNSLQDKLVKIISNEFKNTNIHGYYMGVYKDAIKLTEDNPSNGFLFDVNKNNKEMLKIFSFVSLFETMFLADEGTTLGYKYNSEKKVVPILETDGYEKKDEKIIKFQQGAIRFVEDIKKYEITNDMILSSKASSANIIKFGNQPSVEEIKTFGEITFENYSKNKMINFNHSILFYLFHPKIAKKDFYKSGWRIVFLKKLLPFLFPHFLLFKILCKIFM